MGKGGALQNSWKCRMHVHAHARVRARKPGRALDVTRAPQALALLAGAALAAVRSPRRAAVLDPLPLLRDPADPTRLALDPARPDWPALEAALTFILRRAGDARGAGEDE